MTVVQPPIRPGDRWLVCALRVGPTRHTDPRFFTRRAAAAVAEMLPGTPVGFYKERGRLVHPPRARLSEFTVGRVEAAWLKGDSVFAVFALAPHADRIRRGLLDLERDGRLTDLGVSMILDEPVFLEAMVGGRVVIDGVAGVASLDLVGRPAGVRTCVLRSWSGEPPSTTVRT